MLVELSISNVAIIESLRLQFGSSFSVLTGETGAGKSIIIDAVNLLLGGRASADMIRTGSDSAFVEGVFTLSPQLLASIGPLLQELGVLEDSGELILRREMSRERRNICRVNGHTLTLSALQDIGRHLIDIHGQGEHLSLMRVRRHIDFLDRYGGLTEQRSAFAGLARELRQVHRELRALQQDERELARRADLLAYQIQEIIAASLQPGEEAELKRQRSLLANAEKRLQLSSHAYECLSQGNEEQRAVTDLLGEASETLSTLAELDKALQEDSQLAESSLYQLEELARSLLNYRDSIAYDPKALEAVEERIELIQSLKRKYGDSIEEVMEFAQRAQSELDGISHSEERTEELLLRQGLLLEQIVAQGTALSAARKVAARRLEEDIEAELADLSMEQARFLIDMRWSEAADGVEIGDETYGFDTTGLDRVEFLIAPNPGEEPKPLVKIASGGEASRLMLAMKTALSNIDPVPTLIFDEIDAGIGGRTGDVVGRKLWTLASDHQVWCVTHLPQIACYGKHHFRVTKEVVEGRTISLVQALSDDEHVEEVAIMLGGTLTEATQQSAVELVKRATQATLAKEQISDA